LGCLIAYNSGDVHNMQAGLLGKNFQRLRERLSGYRGGERFGSMGLGKRGRNVSKRKRRAD